MGTRIYPIELSRLLTSESRHWTYQRRRRGRGWNNSPFLRTGPSRWSDYKFTGEYHLTRWKQVPLTWRARSPQAKIETINRWHMIRYVLCIHQGDKLLAYEVTYWCAASSRNTTVVKNDDVPETCPKCVAAIQISQAQ